MHHQEQSTTTASESAKQQLANALEALYSNSKKLESKLDKIEDIRPSANTYIDAAAALTPEPTTAADTDVMNNIFESPQLPPPPPPPPPLIKKKNDTFFNEFLTKSDDLIAQTQFKLERLSKLDSIAATKPVAPKPSVLALEEKMKPASPDTSQPPALPLPPVNNTQLDIGLINNSKSLIDLKLSTSSNGPIDPATTTTTTTTYNNNNTIDLLFDISNDNSFSLNTEPLKQRDSYFDLIGITRNDPLPPPPPLPPSNRSQTPNNILNYSSSGNNSRSQSPYKDDLLDSLLGGSGSQQPETFSNYSVSQLIFSRISPICSAQTNLFSFLGLF